MAHIIITGATGLAGSAVLQQALQSPSIARVSVLSRRPVDLAANHAKAEVLLHSDFNTYPPELLAKLNGASACIWAQGKSSAGMKETDYTRLTVDYPVAAARAFASMAGEGPSGQQRSMTFVYMSGEGADMEKESGGLMFARVKGMAEKKLLALSEEAPALKVYVVRPGGIYHEGEFLAQRPPSFRDKGLNALARVMAPLIPSMAISTDSLAKACVNLATGDGKPLQPGVGIESGGRLLRNSALLRFVGERK